MTIQIVLPVILTSVLMISIALNYYQKRKINKTLRLLALKNQNIMLAIRAGNIAVWGYDVRRGRLYNIEGEVFPADGASIAEAMAEVHPDDCDEFTRILQGVVNGEMLGETICIRFKNMYTGEWEYVEKEFAVIRSRSGEVKTVIGTHKDVTKRVLGASKIDELLKKYQHLYNENQTILNSLPAGVSIYDKEGKMFYLNQAMCDMLGVKDRDRFLDAGTVLWDNPLFDEEIRTQIRKGENTVFSYQLDCTKLPEVHFNPSDKIIYVSCISNIVRNERSEVESYIFIHRDITLQEIQETKVKDMSETLMRVIDASGFSVWEYPIKERKFYSYRGELCVEDGTTYEDTIAKHTPESASLCDTVFHRLIHGITEVEHAMFETVDPESGKILYYKSELVARKDAEGNIVKIYGIQKEITEEHNYQLELEESKLKTQLAIQVSDMVQWEYDVDTRLFHTINERWISDVLTVEDYCQVTHPDDLQMVRDKIDLMDSKRNETFEFDVRFKFPSDNEWQYIKVNGTPLKQNKNGGVLKYTGFQRNNTLWHNLAEELKEKDETNKLILNNMCSGLAYLSPDRKVIWENVSEKFSLDFTNGHKLFEVGRYCPHTHLGIDPFCETCVLDDVWKKRESLTVERILDNGNVLEVMGNPVIDEKGDLSGIVLRIEDITERKRLYKELEVSRNDALSTNQLLREILNRIPGALFIKDTNDDFRYIMANRIFCDIWGKSEDEIIGKTDFEFMEYESAATYRKDDEQILARKEPVIIEEETYTGGVYHCWRTIKSSFTSINNRQLLIAMSVDITEIRKTSDELQKAKNKAEESDVLKSAFLANMSHEIRTPLNAIVGFSELLKDSDDEKEKSEFWNIINTNNELLLRLINDILDLSKIESGTVELKSTQFDLAEKFNEIYSTLRLRNTCKEVEFICDNPYNRCMVTLDENRVTQIITNFVTNAFKFTPKGEIKMGYEYVDEGIRFYCTDTGIGIAPEKMDKIFTRFSKLDDFAQGTGLGAAICKAIVDAYGGKIDVISVVNEGSTFRAWIPCKAGIGQNAGVLTHRTDSTDHVEDVDFTNLRILVAEDNDSNYLLVRSMLKEFELTRVVNGVEAVEKVKKEHFDIILMDIKMPVMGGVEATREIRKFNKTILIIALTANAFDSDKQEALDAGCSDFLTKPISKTKLLGVLYSK